MDVPLIVENRIDGFSFYESPRALTGQLEAWYVDEEEWRAWDASGRRLTLVVDEGLVVARLAEGDTAHTPELRDALALWLDARSRSDLGLTATVSDLIRAGVQLEGLVREHVPLSQRLRKLLRRT